MGIGTSIKLANLWRVVREIDLQVIREQALMPFDLVITGDVDAMAARVQHMLSPHREAAPHQWIHLVPHDANPLPTVPDAAIAVSSRFPLDADLAATVRSLQRARVPMVVVHVAGTSEMITPDAMVYLVVPDLDEASISAIATALIQLVPDERRLALAHRLPPFRPPMFDLTIEETARANATYALTTGIAEVVPVLTAPLNLGDMIVLTKNQLLMSYRLVLASGRDGEPRKLIAEILGVLGGGMLFRQLARQLVGLIPVAGIVPKVAVAYGGTWAIGRAVVLWATDGREVTVDTLRALSAEGLERGRRLARELVARGAASRAAVGGRWARLKAQLPSLPRRRSSGPPG
jgi:uncharacterized protein (DUF697 family)